MDVNNVKSQMRKGMLEYCIMLLLHAEKAYASDIIQKLKSAELLGYEWIESTQGPPRKYYSLTPKGEEFLSELDSAWSELNATVDCIRHSSSIIIES